MNAAFASRRDPAEAGRRSVLIALALLRAYKVLISPYFAGSCRYLPSCSDFAREAVIRHGVMRGTWLAAQRLARCHPLGACGYDPVPLASPARRDSVPESPRNSIWARVRVRRK